VDIDSSTGIFTGYAWPENIDCIDFDPDPDFSAHPGTGYPDNDYPHPACLNWLASISTTEVYNGAIPGVVFTVSGWASTLAYGDGWIKLRGTFQGRGDYGESFS